MKLIILMFVSGNITLSVGNDYVLMIYFLRVDNAHLNYAYLCMFLKIRLKLIICNNTV